MKISCHCNSGKPLFPSKAEVGNIQQSVYKSSLAALKFTSKFWTWSLYYEGNNLKGLPRNIWFLLTVNQQFRIIILLLVCSSKVSICNPIILSKCPTLQHKLKKENRTSSPVNFQVSTVEIT